MSSKTNAEAKKCTGEAKTESGEGDLQEEEENVGQGKHTEENEGTEYG